MTKRKRFWSAFLSVVAVLAIGMLSLPYWMTRPIPPLPTPRDEATRRAAQRERIAEDLTRIGRYYKDYCAAAAKPTSAEFWTYLEAQPDARAICRIIQQQQYAIQVPKDAPGIIGFERDPDLDHTRVVVISDGSVNKIMPEADFQQAIKKGKQ